MLDKIKSSLKPSWDELLYKVSWPTWEELQESSLVVLITSLIIALIIFAMDTVFQSIFTVVYDFFQ